MSGAELYVGIMSGTSLDGVDAALVEFSSGQVKLRGTHYLPYGQALKNTLLALHHPQINELHSAQLTAVELARLYAQAVAALLHDTKTAPQDVRAIGCHGQTIRHRPECGYTLQLNNAAWLAELTGITVVGDFRSRDIAAGGQGAPLVPAFHDEVLRHAAMHRVIVNIGGISNLTDLAPDKAAHGFDCGPGNLLMDAWIARHRGEPFDKEGAWAASGNVVPALLQALLEEPFLHAAPPKSSGRDLFNLDWLDEKIKGDIAPVNVQATLLALTVHTIASAIRRFCIGAEEVYLCGGGAHNKALVAQIEQALPHCRIQKTDALGIAADWMEAIAFAWLAQQAMHGHGANLPAATGARHPCVLGAIYQS